MNRCMDSLMFGIMVVVKLRPCFMIKQLLRYDVEMVLAPDAGPGSCCVQPNFALAFIYLLESWHVVVSQRSVHPSC